MTRRVAKKVGSNNNFQYWVVSRRLVRTIKRNDNILISNATRSTVLFVDRRPPQADPWVWYILVPW